MSPNPLRKRPLRISWDGLGPFQPLDVPLLFPQLVLVSARPVGVEAPPHAQTRAKLPKITGFKREFKSPSPPLGTDPIVDLRTRASTVPLFTAMSTPEPGLIQTRPQSATPGRRRGHTQAEYGEDRRAADAAQRLYACYRERPGNAELWR